MVLKMPKAGNTILIRQPLQIEDIPQTGHYLKKKPESV